MNLTVPSVCVCVLCSTNKQMMCWRFSAVSLRRAVSRSVATNLWRSLPPALFLSHALFSFPFFFSALNFRCGTVSI
jgi:hypothetical protein